MLYGRTNSNQTWELKNISTEPAILFSENNKLIPIPDLLSNLKEQSNTGLFYYVFYLDKKERFVFVTAEKVDYLALNNPENMQLSGICKYVNGILWDLEKKEFVSFGRPEGYFMNFCLYDAGIPNLIFDETEKKYTVFYLMGGEYRFIECKPHYQPTIVSHLWKNNKVGRPINNRIIFLTVEKGNSDAEDMLILHEELEFDSYNENISFFESIPLNMETDSDESYFRSVHGKNAEGHMITNEDFYSVLHLVFDDAIVVQQPYDEYCIVFVEDGKVVFDDLFDCVDYEKVITYDADGREKKCKENIIKVTYKKNDFENGEAVFNVTTKKTT